MNLTKDGQKYVTEYVNEYARPGQNMSAWLDAVEAARDNMVPSESGAVVEISQFDSVDKRTHTLTVPVSMFEVQS